MVKHAENSAVLETRPPESGLDDDEPFPEEKQSNPDSFWRSVQTHLGDPIMTDALLFANSSSLQIMFPKLCS